MGSLGLSSHKSKLKPAQKQAFENSECFLPSEKQCTTQKCTSHPDLETQFFRDLVKWGKANCYCA